jgi:hypothetical protein
MRNKYYNSKRSPIGVGLLYGKSSEGLWGKVYSMTPELVFFSQIVYKEK